MKHKLLTCVTSRSLPAVGSTADNSALPSVAMVDGQDDLQAAEPPGLPAQRYGAGLSYPFEDDPLEKWLELRGISSIAETQDIDKFVLPSGGATSKAPHDDKCKG